MPDLQAKLDELLLLLSAKPEPVPVTDRAVLIIYSPYEELEFRASMDEMLQVLRARGIAHRVLDLELLPFEFLSSQGVLQDAFRMETEDPKGLRQYLGGSLGPFVAERVVAAARELGAGAVILMNTPSLYPWVSYAELLQRLPVGLGCRFVIPFPGRADGAKLHFLNRKEGFNYLARRL